MTLRRTGNPWLFLRGVAVGVALLLCLPPPDLCAAQSSSRSIFSNKRPNYEATRQRNLQELEQRQQMGRPRPQLPAPRRPQVVSLSAVEDLSAVHVPPEYGHVLEAWMPEGSGQNAEGSVGRSTNDQRLATNDHPTVILLQDLHTQYKAQKAEGSVLEHLYRTYGVRQVASEGAAAPFALTFFQQFPRAKTDRTLVAEAFLRVGEMTGHEYQAITQQLPVKMQGVEEEALYQEHLALFRQILAQQAEAQQAVEAIGRSLEAVGQAVASQPVRQLLADAQRFTDGQIPLPQYVELLLRRARGTGLNADTLVPSLAGMSRLAQLEATLPPRDLIAQQQQAFLAALQEAVQAHGAASQRQRMTTLIEQLQAGSVGTAYALERLIASAREFGIALSNYPAVEAFAEYLSLSRTVQAHAVYPELDRLLKALGETLARSGLERRWWQARQAHRLLADAVTAALTLSQWLDYRTTLPDPQAIATFCAEQGQPIAADLAPLVALQPLVARFYELAEQRDRALVENTLRWLEDRDSSPVTRRSLVGKTPPASTASRSTSHEPRVTSNGRGNAVLLIAGGFHTEGITALLRQRQIPYVVIAPTVEGELDQALYHRLIRGETASLPELVAAARASRRTGTILPDTSVMTTKSEAAEIWFVAIAAFVLVGALSGITLNELITQAPDILGPQAPAFTDLVQHLATQPDLPHNQVLAMLQDAVANAPATTPMDLASPIAVRFATHAGLPIVYTSFQEIEPADAAVNVGTLRTMVKGMKEQQKPQVDPPSSDKKKVGGQDSIVLPPAWAVAGGIAAAAWGAGDPMVAVWSLLVALPLAIVAHELGHYPGQTAAVLRELFAGRWQRDGPSLTGFWAITVPGRRSWTPGGLLAHLILIVLGAAVSHVAPALGTALWTVNAGLFLVNALPIETARFVTDGTKLWQSLKSRFSGQWRRGKRWLYVPIGGLLIVLAGSFLRIVDWSQGWPRLNPSFVKVFDGSWELIDSLSYSRWYDKVIRGDLPANVLVGLSIVRTSEGRSEIIISSRFDGESERELVAMVLTTTDTLDFSLWGDKAVDGPVWQVRSAVGTQQVVFPVSPMWPSRVELSGDKPQELSTLVILLEPGDAQRIVEQADGGTITMRDLYNERRYILQGNLIRVHIEEPIEAPQRRMAMHSDEASPSGDSKRATPGRSPSRLFEPAEGSADDADQFEPGAAETVPATSPAPTDALSGSSPQPASGSITVQPASPRASRIPFASLEPPVSKDTVSTPARQPLARWMRLAAWWRAQRPTLVPALTTLTVAVLLVAVLTLAAHGADLLATAATSPPDLVPPAATLAMGLPFAERLEGIQRLVQQRRQELERWLGEQPEDSGAHQDLYRASARVGRLATVAKQLAERLSFEEREIFNRYAEVVEALLGSDRSVAAINAALASSYTGSWLDDVDQLSRLVDRPDHPAEELEEEIRRLRIFLLRSLMSPAQIDSLHREWERAQHYGYLPTLPIVVEEALDSSAGQAVLEAARLIVESGWTRLDPTALSFVESLSLEPRMIASKGIRGHITIPVTSETTATVAAEIVHDAQRFTAYYQRGNVPSSPLGELTNLDLNRTPSVTLMDPWYPELPFAERRNSPSLLMVELAARLARATFIRHPVDTERIDLNVDHALVHEVFRDACLAERVVGGLEMVEMPRNAQRELGRLSDQWRSLIEQLRGEDGLWIRVLDHYLAAPETTLRAIGYHYTAASIGLDPQHAALYQARLARAVGAETDPGALRALALWVAHGLPRSLRWRIGYRLVVVVVQTLPQRIWSYLRQHGRLFLFTALVIGGVGIATALVMPPGAEPGLAPPAATSDLVQPSGLDQRVWNMGGSLEGADGNVLSGGAFGPDARPALTTPASGALGLLTESAQASHSSSLGQLLSPTMSATAAAAKVSTRWILSKSAAIAAIKRYWQTLIAIWPRSLRLPVVKNIFPTSESVADAASAVKATFRRIIQALRSPVGLGVASLALVAVLTAIGASDGVLQPPGAEPWLAPPGASLDLAVGAGPVLVSSSQPNRRRFLSHLIVIVSVILAFGAVAAWLGGSIRVWWKFWRARADARTLLVRGIEQGTISSETYETLKTFADDLFSRNAGRRQEALERARRLEVPSASDPDAVVAASIAMWRRFLLQAQFIGKFLDVTLDLAATDSGRAIGLTERGLAAQALLDLAQRRLDLTTAVIDAVSSDTEGRPVAADVVDVVRLTPSDVRQFAVQPVTLWIERESLIVEQIGLDQATRATFAQVLRRMSDQVLKFDRRIETLGPKIKQFLERWQRQQPIFEPPQLERVAVIDTAEVPTSEVVTRRSFWTRLLTMLGASIVGVVLIVYLHALAGAFGAPEVAAQWFTDVSAGVDADALGTLAAMVPVLRQGEAADDKASEGAPSPMRRRLVKGLIALFAGARVPTPVTLVSRLFAGPGGAGHSRAEALAETLLWLEGEVSKAGLSGQDHDALKQIVEVLHGEHLAETSPVWDEIAHVAVNGIVLDAMVFIPGERGIGYGNAAKARAQIAIRVSILERSLAWRKENDISPDWSELLGAGAEALGKLAAQRIELGKMTIGLVWSDVGLEVGPEPIALDSDVEALLTPLGVGRLKGNETRLIEETGQDIERIALLLESWSAWSQQAGFSEVHEAIEQERRKIQVLLKGDPANPESRADAWRQHLKEWEAWKSQRTREDKRRWLRQRRRAPEHQKKDGGPDPGPAKPLPSDTVFGVLGAGALGVGDDDVGVSTTAGAVDCSAADPALVARGLSPVMKVRNQLVETLQRVLESWQKVETQRGVEVELYGRLLRQELLRLRGPEGRDLVSRQELDKARKVLREWRKQPAYTTDKTVLAAPGIVALAGGQRDLALLGWIVEAADTTPFTALRSNAAGARAWLAVRLAFAQATRVIKQGGTPQAAAQEVKEPVKAVPRDSARWLGDRKLLGLFEEFAKSSGEAVRRWYRTHRMAFLTALTLTIAASLVLAVGLEAWEAMQASHPEAQTLTALPGWGVDGAVGIGQTLAMVPVDRPPGRRGSAGEAERRDEASASEVVRAQPGQFLADLDGYGDVVTAFDHLREVMVEIAPHRVQSLERIEARWQAVATATTWAEALPHLKRVHRFLHVVSREPWMRYSGARVAEVMNEVGIACQQLESVRDVAEALGVQQLRVDPQHARRFSTAAIRLSHSLKPLFKRDRVDVVAEGIEAERIPSILDDLAVVQDDVTRWAGMLGEAGDLGGADEQVGREILVLLPEQGSNDEYHAMLSLVGWQYDGRLTQLINLLKERWYAYSLGNAQERLEELWHEAQADHVAFPDLVAEWVEEERQQAVEYGWSVDDRLDDLKSRAQQWLLERIVQGSAGPEVQIHDRRGATYTLRFAVEGEHEEDRQVVAYFVSQRGRRQVMDQFFVGWEGNRPYCYGIDLELPQARQHRGLEEAILREVRDRLPAGIEIRSGIGHQRTRCEIVSGMSVEEAFLVRFFAGVFDDVRVMLGEQPVRGRIDPSALIPHLSYLRGGRRYNGQGALREIRSDLASLRGKRRARYQVPGDISLEGLDLRMRVPVPRRARAPEREEGAFESPGAGDPLFGTDLRQGLRGRQNSPAMRYAAMMGAFERASWHQTAARRANSAGSTGSHTALGLPRGLVGQVFVVAPWVAEQAPQGVARLRDNGIKVRIFGVDIRYEELLVLLDRGQAIVIGAPDDFEGLGVRFDARFVDISGLVLNADTLIDAINRQFAAKALQTQEAIQSAK